MNKKKHKSKQHRSTDSQNPIVPIIDRKVVDSFLDNMIDGKEYQSTIDCKPQQLDFAVEIRKSLKEINACRDKYVICYLSNMINQGITANNGVDISDDLPFSEMINSIPQSEKSVDFILVTPGGSAEQVSKFVDLLRARFDEVNFIIPHMAMSAGTIMIMSGDEIIMSKNSYFGPIDPQVPNSKGRYVPAQALLSVLEDIRDRGNCALSKGENPNWADVFVLQQIDHYDLGNVINASGYSIGLVKDYLANWKFRNWEKNGVPVSKDHKEERAEQIAKKLCDHLEWKTHGRGINRTVAEDQLRLRITHTENIPGLDRALRRFWALIYRFFEDFPVYKVFISEDYAIFRHQMLLKINEEHK